MLPPHIVSALLVEREADLRRRAEQARLRRPDPWTDWTLSGITAAPERAPEHGPRPRWRRRLSHLRPV
ncbi:hypothetical protein [Terrabacter terrigena]|uniref:Uncharacterized protein n=1 Tax=Terrabacter terrigena TaxID=574718 RepID=A0ABW3N4Q3_9MICO